MSTQYTCQLVLVFLLALLSGCATDTVLEVAPHRHVMAAKPVAGAIPKPMLSAPPLPKPTAAPSQETYSVVAHRLSVNSLLFALARDARINLDVHPGITGEVTLNALDQTLPQILNRIARQVNLRWSLESGVLTAMPDTPYLKVYHVDYLNLARDMRSSVTLANSVAGTGSKPDNGSGNSSNTRIEGSSEHRFWQRLQANIEALLEAPATPAAPPAAPPAVDAAKAAAIAPPPSTPTTFSPGGTLVIVHPETGTLTVRASERNHARVADYLASVEAGARRQVMIEATIVEVMLSDQYQAGVDWSRLTDGSAGLSLGTSFTGGNLAQSPFSVFSYTDVDGVFGGTFNLTVRLLEQFGRTRVLSSPRVIALNNQTALMKVVEEQVYFTIDIEEDRNTDGEITNRTYDSTLHTVPVGLVLQVVPQISGSGQILLNVRPTITNISGYVEDPAVAIVAANANVPVKSLVPVLQVREFDSTLRIASGEVAVLGGLIQDTLDAHRAGLPGATRLPLVGDLFSYRDDKLSKIELVVFLRPRIVEVADIRRGDLEPYAKLLPDEHFFSAPDDQALWAFHGGSVPAGGSAQ
ncbi:MAG TPA: secretin N-terminal domain-containing protein [Chitinolyticbacter sp.]|nr:secretin N-terminal domain-containing protein [Chitinolyticbacter sp.]